MMDEAAQRRRGTRTLVALLLLPPLAPLAWAWWSGANRVRFLRAPLLRIGLALFGVAPLPIAYLVLRTMAGSASPGDPRAAGLALLGGWTLATICMTAGVTLVEVAIRRDAAADHAVAMGPGQPARER
jgi:hypothetical protein